MIGWQLHQMRVMRKSRIEGCKGHSTAAGSNVPGTGWLTGCLPRELIMLCGRSLCTGEALCTAQTPCAALESFILLLELPSSVP